MGTLQIAPAVTQAQRYTTTADLTSAMVHTTPPAFGPAPSLGYHPVIVNPDNAYQTVLGVGAALTDSSAYVFVNYLTAQQRTNILTELWSPDQCGLSTVRIGFGATGFNSKPLYSYDDVLTGASDPNLVAVNLLGDAGYLIPQLQQIVAINPRVKIHASIWCTPAWMTVQQEFQSQPSSTTQMTMALAQVYANYIVEVLQTFQSYGIPIYSITPYNEPFSTGGSWTFMLPADYATIIGGYLGPALDAAGLDTKILIGDHHWAFISSFQSVLTSPPALNYADGCAWHAYSGSPLSQTIIKRQYPQLSQHMTEIRSLTSQDGPTTMALMAGLVLIGTMRNWGNSLTMWNVALDENGGPQSGAAGRRGVIVVPSDSSANIVRNIEYYVLRHFGQFVKPGAKRIASTNYSQAAIVTGTIINGGTDIESVAFQNPDQSIVLFLYNPTTSPVTFRVADSRTNQSYPVTMAATSMETHTWGLSLPVTVSPATPVVPSAPVLSGSGAAGIVNLTWTVPSSTEPLYGYLISRSVNGGAYASLATVPPTSAAFTDNYAAGGTLAYKVQALSAAGSSVASNIQSVTVGAASIPGQVTGLTLGTTTYASQALTWTAVFGASVYRVEYSVHSANSWTLSQIVAGTAATVTGLLHNTNYDHRVSAVNFLGTGTPSSTVTASTPAPPALLNDMGVAAFWAIGLRKLSSTATKCVNVRRSSDNTTQDIGFATSTNDLDTAALATFVGSNSGYIVTFYDQSGNGRDLTQATAANQAQLVNAGTLNTLNGLPAALFNGTSAVYVGSTVGLYAAGQATELAVAAYGSAATFRSLGGEVNTTGGGAASRYALIETNGPDSTQLFSLIADQNGTFAQRGSVVLGDLVPWTGALKQLSLTDTGTLLTGYVAGGSAATLTYARTGHTPTLNFYTLGGNGAAAFWGGSICELATFTAALSDSVRQIGEVNQKSYWATT